MPEINLVPIESLLSPILPNVQGPPTDGVAVAFDDVIAALLSECSPEVPPESPQTTTPLPKRDSKEKPLPDALQLPVDAVKLLPSAVGTTVYDRPVSLVIAKNGRPVIAKPTEPPIPATSILQPDLVVGADYDRPVSLVITREGRPQTVPAAKERPPAEKPAEPELPATSPAPSILQPQIEALAVLEAVAVQPQVDNGCLQMFAADKDVEGCHDEPSPSSTPISKAMPELRPGPDLQEFDIRRFEFKVEMELAATPLPKLIQMLAPPPSPLSPPLPSKSEKTASLVEGGGSLLEQPEQGSDSTPFLVTAPEEVHRVQVVIEPPPPPPIARQVSMDIGDPDSQVRVIIRERNGSLSLHFDAASEQLRDDLQSSAPQLIEELQRNNPHSVRVDFTHFGSATESGGESRHHERPKKPLKPEAVFADLDETAYLEPEPPLVKSL